MDYRVEWQASCVDEELIDLNVTPLEGLNSLDYLLYSDQLPRNNDGRVSSQFLKRYEHTEDGGWWCSGVDVLTGKEDLWGCFKPNNPRLSGDKQKVIKYEHPPKEQTGLFALRVPDKLWQEIAIKSGIETITPEESDFWSWLLAHPEVPICITEGAKKAGTLLSAGYAAIALPGINNGYRTPKDAHGNRTARPHLIPQLQLFAQPGREIYIVFDQDTRPSTVKAVNTAITKMGSLLSQNGCKVKVVTWNMQLGKGVDDLIAENGVISFTQAYNKAPSLEVWKAQILHNLTYSAAVELNSRYLPTLVIPSTARLIALKSPQGTGKTECLAQIVQKAISEGRQILVIGHRIKLVEELCQRFGLEYISQVKDKINSLGYGLCIDSLHPQSQAQFNPQQWADALVILDEVEQVLWHGLNSSTCRNHRVAILKSLKQLMQNVLEGDGQVYIADADLSDISIDYLISLAEVAVQPYLIQNSWQPSTDQAYPIYYYAENTPKRLVKDLVKELQKGGKAFVSLSAQQLKSQWGTRTLELYLKQQFPDLKILRIDSESLCEPDHPAYNCLSKLNEILLNYDLVLASPSIETGISIDIKGHFTSVWSIAQGVQTATSVCQALGRVRENIPRYVWAAPYGFNKIGNGATSLTSLLTSGERLTQINIRLLQQSDIEGWDDVNTDFQAESLLCWAKMAIRVNVAMISYRESILSHLSATGHSVEVRKKKVKTNGEEDKKLPGESLTEVIKAVQAENYQAECQAILKAPSLSPQEYQNLKKSPLKTPQQRQAIKKHLLKQRYGIPVTSELVTKDDQGWYSKIRLHYFLTIGRPYLADRDTLVAQKILQQGKGQLFLPDFNISQLGASIGVLEILGLPTFLQDLTREFSNQQDDLQYMAELAVKHRYEIKTVTGISISKTGSPILILRQFVVALGHSLTYICYRGSGKKRARIYQIILPSDGRQKVFAQWLRDDMSVLGGSELKLLDEYQNSHSTDTRLNSLAVQLELNF